jgi:sulfur relay (sulfurtransferase) complex TusBCD TusD component (DsrE family)
MPNLPGEEEVRGGGRGRLGVVLYTSPTSSHFDLGIQLAKAALKAGYDVELFAWGDAVYGTVLPDAQHEGTTSNPLLALMNAAAGPPEPRPSLELNLCTSCFKIRGLPKEVAIRGAHLGGLHNIVGLFQECDRTLVLVP